MGVKCQDRFGDLAILIYYFQGYSMLIRSSFYNFSASCGEFFGGLLVIFCRSNLPVAMKSGPGGPSYRGGGRDRRFDRLTVLSKVEGEVPPTGVVYSSKKSRLLASALGTKKKTPMPHWSSLIAA